MTFSYLNKSKNWVEIPIENYIYPINYTLGVDETTDISEFNIQCNNSDNYSVDMLFKGEGQNIEPRYWIAKDIKESNLKHSDEKIVTLTLMEPIEILQGFKLEPCKFAEASYTFNNVIYRLFRLAKFDALLDETINITYNNTELQFVQSTLYLALFEIARSIDCVPYLEFDESEKKWRLKFEKLDLENKKVYEM